ncbi:DUF362 domain-containing protein [Candidatus Sumerlaeota bacterium]|nr:DUF362 domain-containing protein [Candidatus Sumerlaeota bacterium]
MEEAEWTRHVSRDSTVALKVNLGWDKLIPGAISAPWVVEGVIRTVKDYARKVCLVESDQVVVNVERALRLTRIDRLCRDYGVEWINMSKGKYVSVRDESRLALKDIRIPEILTRAEIITLPVMKTHNKSVITGGIKNQWGCLPTLRHNFHLVLSEALVDLNTILRPRFAVMDGTVALEGNGPKSGEPKEMGLVLASGDLVALDTVAAQVMGFNPLEIEHLCLCARHGLGKMNMKEISVVGEQISSVAQPFKPAKHNAVSWLELALRKSFFCWLVFKTPMLGLFCWGARRYYDLWDGFVGRRLRDKFMRTSPYAAQWR